jgi:hypothetical protein
MVLRFFKDKKSTPILPNPSSPVLEARSTMTAQTLADQGPAENNTTIPDSVSVEGQVNNQNLVEKASNSSPVAPIIEHDFDGSADTKSDKSMMVATKPLTDYVQMASMQSSAEDVIAAYKIFLGRLPESAQVVQQRTGLPVATLLIDFLASAEFLGHPMRAKLLLGLAKRVIESQSTGDAQPD